MPATVTTQPTPNPNAMKFTVAGQPITDGPSRTFASAAEAEGDPLAARIMAIANIRQVFFLRDFVTVTKEADAHWLDIAPLVESALKEHFA